jgi:hypothetical protein
LEISLHLDENPEEIQGLKIGHPARQSQEISSHFALAGGLVIHADPEDGLFR